MLTSQVIYLKLKDGSPRNVKGNHIHGLFFDRILVSQAPELAKLLHSPGTTKPFSLSFLYKEGHIYWFRIASWIDEISEAVFSYFDHNFQVTLNNCLFELMRTSTDVEEFQWARRTSVGEFIKNAKAMNRDTFWIEHYSETSFKCGNTHLPLPVPELIVNSIDRQLMPQIAKELSVDPEKILELIHLKEYRIRSVYNRKNYGSIASFKGKTRWQIDKRASQRERDAIRILFNFAFYSGIGVKTTQGMGMCRIIERP